MKEEILKKFEGIRNKWIYFHSDSYMFDVISEQLKIAVNEERFGLRQANKITKCFKKQEKCFIKFNRNVGRKNFYCECVLIDEENNKLKLKIKPEEVLEANLLKGTPKSLKLYSSKEKNKGSWKKPNDGFIDPIDYPPVEEELTELGYQMYKDWTEEVQASGLTSIEYIRKLSGTDKYYRRN